jgi:2-polyprenyl-3-methyl-5-hydroxy-6-metoxy-1,4-benzoquinol methylase
VKDHLFRKYGTILGTTISPISIFALRYYEKNYGKTLRSIPKNSKILEIGPGSASFTQYLLHKDYEDITVCEIADDNAQALRQFFGDRIRVIHKDAIDYLGSTPDRFDLIFAAQVIEHFTHDDLIIFLQNCYASLNDGGYMILETINCANVIYGLYLRYCDYSHRMGFTPRSLKQFLNITGSFSSLEFIEIQPTGFLDCLHYIYHRIKRNKMAMKNQAGIRSNPPVIQRNPRRLLALILRAPAIRLSRWLSALFMGYYEFDRIRAYTPFFAIAARKACNG